MQSEAGRRCSSGGWNHFSHSALQQIIYHPTGLFCVCVSCAPLDQHYLLLSALRQDPGDTDVSIWKSFCRQQALNCQNYAKQERSRTSLSSICFILPMIHASVPRGDLLTAVLPPISRLTRVQCSIDLSLSLTRSVEFSLYQESPHPQMQEVAPKEPSADPGTLV